MPQRSLCRLTDLAATGAKGVTLQLANGVSEIVVVRHGSKMIAFENRCPHLQMPLEIIPDRFLDETGDHLVCTTHGARFRVSDGYCISGPCQGLSLAAVEVQLEGDDVRLASPQTG